jgi:hypothetical protein
MNYPWEVATPTSDLTTAKLLFNSVISTTSAVFVILDVKISISAPPWIVLNFHAAADKMHSQQNH